MQHTTAEHTRRSHGHAHNHNGHDHGQHHMRSSSRRALVIALAITTAFFVVEVVGALVTGSLALLADAGHMLTDVAALLLSLGAWWLAQRPPTPQRTFGLYRAEILAASINAVTLILISIYIFYEAIQRLGAPPAIDSIPMLVVATAGLGANIASAWVLARSRSESLNTRGAYLHVLGDALGSLGVIVAAVVMLTLGWYVADPLISIVIGAFIIWSSWRLLSETLNVLLEAAPPNVDVRAIRSAVLQHPDVADVHDLHVWTVTSGFVALSCHVRLGQDLTSEDHRHLLGALRTLLHARFGIAHATIQIEAPDFEEAEAGTCCL